MYKVMEKVYSGAFDYVSSCLTQNLFIVLSPCRWTTWVWKSMWNRTRVSLWWRLGVPRRGWRCRRPTWRSSRSGCSRSESCWTHKAASCLVRDYITHNPCLNGAFSVYLYREPLRCNCATIPISIPSLHSLIFWRHCNSHNRFLSK